jgi:hypothetical protein
MEQSMLDVPTILSASAADTEDGAEIVAKYMVRLSETYAVGGEDAAQALLTEWDEQAKAAKDEERRLLNLVVWTGCMVVFGLGRVVAHPLFKSRCRTN